LVVQVLAIGTLALLALRAVDADRAVRVARAQHRGHLVELASAVPEMALLNREDLAVARLSNAVSTLNRAEAAQRRQRRGANALVALGGLLALSAVVLRPHTSSVWLVVATLVGLATFDALNAVRSSLRAAVEVAGGAERLESLGEVATKGARPWPDDTTLRLEGVTLREEGRTLVDAGSFAVTPGEHVAVVGDSGVGKSTLLRALATLDDHHLGSITVGGHALPELDEGDLRRHLAYVPAEPGLTRGYALDVVALGRASVRDSLDDLARLGLTVERTTRFDELSRGERARVALARALVTDPAILVLDEPTAGLGELETRGVLDLLAGTAATVIVATHDAQVVAWCDVVVTLRSDGQLRVTR
jgi:ABC-type transport system involved in cytochrome bd biosynthesis fused ATPase/permease subunit